MFILDENFRHEQQAILSAWGIRTRKVGKEISAFGTDDGDLIPLILRQPSPTFFTHDVDFWHQPLWHPGYCLAWLDMDDILGARYVRRFLRHVNFDTSAKRLGKIVRVHPDGLTFYDSRHSKPKHATWLRAV